MAWRRIQIFLLFMFLVIILIIQGCTEAKDTPVAECCTPFCVALGSEECSQRGGSWSGTECSTIDQCQESCCTPFCVDLGKEECTQRGGVSSGTGCSTIDECQKGCCTPFCTELTKAECSSEQGYGGDWNSGSCQEQDECQKVCCQPSDTLMTKVECQQAGGEEQDASECEEKGLKKGTITIEITRVEQCDTCKGQARTTCPLENNVLERFTATYAADPNPSPTIWGEFNSRTDFEYNVGKSSFFKGTGTYTLTVASKATSVYTSDSGEANIRENSITSNELVSAEVALIIKELDEEAHEFIILIPQGGLKFVNKQSETGSQDYSNTVEDEGDLPSTFTAKAWSGTTTFSGRPISDFLPPCDNYEGDTGKITWSFE